VQDDPTTALGVVGRLDGARRSALGRAGEQLCAPRANEQRSRVGHGAVPPSPTRDGPRGRRESRRVLVLAP
jgi:hypothetical protein